MAPRQDGQFLVPRAPSPHDRGAAGWAMIASLLETCKLNRVDPSAWTTNVRRFTWLGRHIRVAVRHGLLNELELGMAVTGAWRRVLSFNRTDSAICPSKVEQSNNAAKR